MNENKLILGTVQMGLPYGINNDRGQITKHGCIQILSYGRENNVTILDTAEAYGNAHSIIGDFHKDLSDIQKYKIITKVPHDFNSELESTLMGYLQDLKVDRLHALLFHSFDSYIQQVGILEKMVLLKKRGMIDNIGVSIYTNDQFRQCIEDPEIDIIQIPFNIFDNLDQRGELLRSAKTNRKVVHSRSCFLQGLFFSNPFGDKEIVRKLKNELLKINDIAKAHDLPIAQLALNYCLQQPLLENVLIGIDSLGQLKENIAFATKRLPANIIDQLDDIKIKNSQLLNPSLWQKT